MSERPASAPDRLLILAPNWLGDAVMALPLIADVQRAWPDTELVVAARRSVVPLFARVRGVSRTIAMARRWWVAGRSPRSGRTSPASRRAPLRRRSCCRTHFRRPGWRRVRAFPSGGDSRAICADVCSRARSPGRGRACIRPSTTRRSAPGSGWRSAIASRAWTSRTTTDRARVRSWPPPALSVEQRFAVFAPGAAYGRAKQWLPERFAELAALLAEHGCATVLVGTSADESVCDEIARTGTGTGTGTFNLVRPDRSDESRRSAQPQHRGRRERLRRDAPGRRRRRACRCCLRPHRRSKDVAASRPRLRSRSR